MIPQSSSRRRFIKNSAVLAAALPLVRSTSQAAEPGNTKLPETLHDSPEGMVRNLPSMVEADGRLRFEFGDERMVIDGGLQPFLFVTAKGTLVAQVQSPNQPFPSKRMHYGYAMWTVVSRDNGQTWIRIPLKPGDNGLNLEGGAVQLRDGTILALDTYIVPGAKPYVGSGQLYSSTDDWMTLQGPFEATFDLPKINFYASKDDGGRPHEAERLHRSIVELPNGDLLTVFYGHLEGDATPSTYMPTMMKSRVMLARSSDRGKNWKLVSTAAVDPNVGTEGMGEPVLVRLTQGPKMGRLICFMRTGRELYEVVSDDEGVTWTKPAPRTFAGLDINRTELWVDMFRNVKRRGKAVDENNPDELKGAVVDPDLIELRSGLLVAAFGVRVPQKACWTECRHPWNGNYIAVSRDQGATWSNVVRLTSGVMTTHYMGVRELAQDNEIFVVYDFGAWGKPSRYSYGRTVKISGKPA